MRRRDFLRGLAASGALSLGGTALTTAAPAPAGGIDATWTTGEQYGIGTVADHGTDDPSRVWFALTEGALTGVRFPRVDFLNVRTLDLVVTDTDSEYAARTHNVSRTDDDTSTVERRVEPTAEDALLFRHVVSETGGGRDWTLTVEYATDSEHDALLADVSFEARDGANYDVYAVLDPSLSNSGKADVARVSGASDPGQAASDGKKQGTAKGNGKGKGQDGGPVLTARDTGANDDAAAFRDADGEAYNVAAAFVADRGFDWATVDVVGGDSLSPLLTTGDASTTYENAEGNVALVGRLGSGVTSLSDTLSLGFAEEADESAATTEATGALDKGGFARTRATYRQSWRDYLAELDVPDAVGDDDLRWQYDVAAMALKAADSKQYPGAGLASLSVPWGNGTKANDPADYGYNFVWSRDLYNAFTALLAAGDVHSATEAVAYIYEYQQDDAGFIPQNTFIDGRTRWGGEQMDNISFPQIMAYQLAERHGVDLGDAGYDYTNVKRSADYVATNGPETAQERWEEEGGYSPSTTAAEIAGLVCAASLAVDEGDDDARADALVYLGLADHWQANTANWMATTTGSKSADPYYVRITDDRDPDDGATLDINNGGPSLDEREVVDAGFLELVRLGVKPWDDSVVRNSLEVVDDTIRVDTPNGPAFYRYNGDGYGEQGQDPNDSLPPGAPWGLNGDYGGKGRLWPIFTGERAEYELLADTDSGATAPDTMLRAMADFANSGGMIPEQVWDRPEETEFGWEFGEGTGSATPLSWSMAQYVRLAHGIDAGEPVETPAVVRDRYVDGEPAEGPELTVEFPDDSVVGSVQPVSGTTDATDVVVFSESERVHVEPTDGTFSTEIDLGDGESLVKVVAADAADSLAETGTTLAEKTVTVFDLGEQVAAFDDPAGDDAGPGSYTYPTADVFKPGVFDLDALEVYETDDRYQFLYRFVGPVANPWGGSGGFSVQHLQLYIRDPAASGGTTEAREGVNATFESAYHRRVAADGFTNEFAPRVEAADGSVVTEDVELTAYQSIDAIKVGIPKSSLSGLGSLDSLAFVPLVLGQDGFSPGRIRPVQASNGAYVFGGGRDDSANPNVIDLATPEGVTNADALAYSAEQQATVPYLTL
nr:glucodextranase DOMON-like domain-containing protein [Halogranum gelatinilyticum]